MGRTSERRTLDWAVKCIKHGGTYCGKTKCKKGTSCCSPPRTPPAFAPLGGAGFQETCAVTTRLGGSWLLFCSGATISGLLPFHSCRAPPHGLLWVFVALALHQLLWRHFAPHCVWSPALLCGLGQCHSSPLRPTECQHPTPPQAPFLSPARSISGTCVIALSSPDPPNS